MSNWIKRSRLTCGMAAALLMPALLWGSAAAAAWPGLADVAGQAWLVIDRETGASLIEHEADRLVYPASTTKILTAILALESGRLGETTTVSGAAVDLSASSSRAGFLAGEQVVLRDALYGMMLASGNDAANILAEALAGDVPAFAALMNRKAADIGMRASHFVNPNGLHDPAHITTARDMARLAAYAMQMPAFREIVATTSYSLPATNLHPYDGWSVFNNSNRLIPFGSLYYPSSLITSYDGIKTGTTRSAGNCLIAAATSTSGQNLVSVLLGVPDSVPANMYNATRTLLEEAARLGGAMPVTPTVTPTAAPTAGPTVGPTPTQPAVTGTPAMTSAAITPGGPSVSPAASAAPLPGPDGEIREIRFWQAATGIFLVLWLATLATVLIWMARGGQPGHVRPRRIKSGRK